MEKTGGTYIAWGLDGGTHEARGLKPMLTPEEQVALLKAKGVAFERCDKSKGHQSAGSQRDISASDILPETVSEICGRARRGALRKLGLR